MGRMAATNSTVIARLDRAIQYAATSVVERMRHWIPVFAGMTWCGPSGMTEKPKC